MEVTSKDGDVGGSDWSYATIAKVGGPGKTSIKMVIPGAIVTK